MVVGSRNVPTSADTNVFHWLLGFTQGLKGLHGSPKYTWYNWLLHIQRLFCMSIVAGLHLAYMSRGFCAFQNTYHLVFIAMLLEWMDLASSAFMYVSVLYVIHTIVCIIL